MAMVPLDSWHSWNQDCSDLLRRGDQPEGFLEWYARRQGGPPLRNPTRPPIRERILALYRQQGRPQAHLDRVMRLGRV